MWSYRHAALVAEGESRMVVVGLDRLLLESLKGRMENKMIEGEL